MTTIEGNELVAKFDAETNTYYCYIENIPCSSVGRTKEEAEKLYIEIYEAYNNEQKAQVSDTNK